MVHRGMKETNLTLRRLHWTLEQHVIEEQRLHQELEFARQVQQSLLPTASPRVPGFRFYQYYQPAREVGGDYFDYVHLPGRRLAVAVGDVAGKGVPAALLMARVSTEERYCLLTERTASEALTRLNQELTPSIGDRFVTCVFLILDLESYQVTLVNAGHLPPLLRRGGSPIVEHVGTETAGLPLGVAPEVPYVQTEFSLQQGDVLALFTDGLTEAENLSGELYQLQRLAAIFSCGPGQVDAIADTVLKDVKRFTSGTSLRDDVTLICFGREG
jgi:phosphoserine phosphatase RsbU/P